MPADHDCSMGYICDRCATHVPTSPTGAWWFACDCGGLYHPALVSEVPPAQGSLL